MFIAGDFFKMVPEREEEGLPAEYPAQALRDCLMDAESSRSSETPLAHRTTLRASQGCENPQPFPTGWTEVGGLSEAFIYWGRQCSGMALMAAVLLDPAAQVPVWAG